MRPDDESEDPHGLAGRFMDRLAHMEATNSAIPPKLYWDSPGVSFSRNTSTTTALNDEQSILLVQVYRLKRRLSSIRHELDAVNSDDVFWDSGRQMIAIPVEALRQITDLLDEIQKL